MPRLLSGLGFALLLVATVVSAGFALSGRGGGLDVADLIGPICAEGTTVEERADGEPVAEEVGTPSAYAVCEAESEHSTELVEAFVVASDPDRDLLNTADGWESGDGTGVTWAIKPHGDDWVAVVAVGETFDQDAFEALADEGFELHSNPSSPLEGYDDYYGG